jgi:hypothetical protein
MRIFPPSDENAAGLDAEQPARARVATTARATIFTRMGVLSNVH